MEYTSGTSSWGAALRRLGNGLRPHRIRLSTWSILVPVVALIAGLLFTTSAHTAGGIDLRDDRTPQLTTLIDDRTRQIDAAEKQASRLRKSNLAQTDQLAGSDSGVAAQQQRANGSLGAAGLVAVRGPGLTVIAQRRAAALRRQPIRPAPGPTMSSCTSKTCRRSSTRCGRVAEKL